MLYTNDIGYACIGCPACYHNPNFLLQADGGFKLWKQVLDLLRLRRRLRLLRLYSICPHILSTYSVHICCTTAASTTTTTTTIQYVCTYVLAYVVHIYMASLLVRLCSPPMPSTYVVHMCCPHILSTYLVHISCPHIVSTYVVLRLRRRLRLLRLYSMCVHMC
jgi:hypothetical protein